MSAQPITLVEEPEFKEPDEVDGELLESEPYTLPLGRKFWVTIAAMLSATLLVAFDKIDAGVYATVMVAAVGGYMAANVSQKNLLKDQE